MKDHFLEIVSKRVAEIPDTTAVPPRDLLAIEDREVKAHPFWYAWHLMMLWWSKVNG